MRKVLSLPHLGESGMEIPYFEIVGKVDGPQLTILAGVHGAEYAAIAAVKKFVIGIDPGDVIGRIIAVPIVNLLGFWSRSPFIVPADGKNLNRNFPGDINGSFTEILAHHIFTNFIMGADFLVDLHAGDIPESLVPFSIYDESPVEERSRELALAYGLPHSVRQSSAVRTIAGSTCAAAADIGIPAIVAESGQNGLVERSAIDTHLVGLRNLARSIGVLKGEVLPPRLVQFYNGWNWLRADRAGWWNPIVATGAQVAGGDLLGTMSDLWGDIFAEIYAPESGVILFQTSSPAVSVDGILVGLARR